MLQVVLLPAYHPSDEEASNRTLLAKYAGAHEFWDVSLTCLHISIWQVVLLPVYHPSDEEASNPALYAQNVRALMARELGAVLSDHGLDDNVALKKNHVHVNFTGTKVIMAAD